MGTYRSDGGVIFYGTLSCYRGVSCESENDQKVFGQQLYSCGFSGTCTGSSEKFTWNRCRTRLRTKIHYNKGKEAKKSDKVFLATDPDREGEAISWHLATALKLDEKKMRRITFNEITKNAVKASLKAPRDIDMNLVDAQQARRVLDRMV